MSGRFKLPIVTLLLLGANLLLAFALVAQPDLLVEFGMNPNHPSLFTFFSGPFLHANVFHLFGNMIFLAAVGSSLELATGTVRFLAVYLLSGLGGELGHWAMYHSAPGALPLIGASGAIAGCVGYYAIRYRWLSVPIGPKLRAPIYGITLVWVGSQVLGAIVQIGNPNSALSYISHVAGFCTGVLCSLAFRAPDLRQEALDKQTLDEFSQRGPAASAAVARKNLVKYPSNPELLETLADALETLGEVKEEVQTRIKIISQTTGEERINDLERIRQLNELHQISPGMLLSLGKELLHPGEVTDSVECPSETSELSFAVLNSVPKNSPERPDALYLIAEFWAEKNQPRTQTAYLELQNDFPSHPAEVRCRARGYTGASQ